MSQNDANYSPKVFPSRSPYSGLPRNIMPISPTPRPLPIDIHRNRTQANPNRNPPNGKKHVPNPLSRNPIIQIIRQSKRKHVLDKIHRSERFAGFVSMAVYDVGYDAGGAELNAEINEPESDDHGNFPRVVGVAALAPGEETSCSEEEVGYHDWEAEFGFCPC